MMRSPMTIDTDRRSIDRGPLAVLALFALLVSPFGLAAPAALAQDGAAQDGEAAGEVTAREEPPAGGEPKDFELPTPKRFTLDNGMKVTLVPFGRVPRVQARIVVRTGNIDEAADQVWLADLLGRLMSEGAGERDSKALAEAFASIGGELSLGVGLDYTMAFSRALSDLAPDLVRLLGDVVLRPALPAEEIERLRNDMLRNLSVARTQPGSMANEKMAALTYGDHPYGRLYPTEEQLRSYEIDQVRAFYDANFGAARSHLYLVGVFDTAAVDTAIHEAFGAWKKGPEPTLNVPDSQLHSGEIHLIDRPGASQSTLRLGLPVVDPSHEDFMALQVTNALLGGSFSSRITANIREDKGYTYSPGSSITPRYREAFWTSSADVTTSVTGPALKEIYYEINRLQAEPPPAEELEGIQNYLAGSFVRRNSNPGGIAFQLFYVDFHGLGDEYLETYVQQVHAVTPEKVQEMTKKYLRDEDMTLVVVGDASQVESQLKDYGKVIR